MICQNVVCFTFYEYFTDHAYMYVIVVSWSEQFIQMCTTSGSISNIMHNETCVKISCLILNQLILTMKPDYAVSHAHISGLCSSSNVCTLFL